MKSSGKWERKPLSQEGDHRIALFEEATGGSSDFSLVTDRERRVVQRHFGLDDHPSMTLQAIGKIIGLSGEAIRQIQIKALKKLRPHERTVRLGPFLEKGSPDGPA